MSLKLRLLEAAASEPAQTIGERIDNLWAQIKATPVLTAVAVVLTVTVGAVIYLFVKNHRKGKRRK